MTDYAKLLLPRFRYGVIRPRAHEDVQRGPCYQLYRLVPNDFMEISTGLGLENYTKRVSRRRSATIGLASSAWPRRKPI